MKQLCIRVYFPSGTIIFDWFLTSFHKDLWNADFRWVITNRSCLGQLPALANSSLWYRWYHYSRSQMKSLSTLSQMEFSVWHWMSEFMVVVPNICKIKTASRENIFPYCLSSIVLKNQISNHSYPWHDDWQVKAAVWQLTINKFHFFFFLRALGTWYFPTFPLIKNG